MARDRISALEGAVRRTRQMDDLLDRGRFEVTPRRRHVGRRPGPPRRRPRRRLDRRRPARGAARPAAPGRPLPRALADEALILARKLPVPRF